MNAINEQDGRAMRLVSLTDAAARRVKELIEKSERPVFGLRLDVKTTGCSGLGYVVEYAEERREGEDVVEDKGVAICIDPMAQMFLFGTEIDYEESTLQSGFVFRNPNEAGRCGCGESFSV